MPREYRACYFMEISAMIVWLKKKFKVLGLPEVQGLILIVTCFTAIWIGNGQNSINTSLLKIQEAESRPFLFPTIEDFTFDPITKQCLYRLKIENIGKTPIKDIQIKMIINHIDKNSFLTSFTKTILPPDKSVSRNIIGCEEEMFKPGPLLMKARFKSFYEEKEYCLQSNFILTPDMSIASENIPTVCDQW